MDPPAPGSFRTDDVMGTASISTGPNKLHKPNDPRGDPSYGKTTPGHFHTDSGVGLTETSDLGSTTYPNQSAFDAQRVIPTDEKNRNALDPDPPGTTFFASGHSETNRSVLQTNDAAQSAEQNFSSQDDRQSCSVAKHRYRGVGVYNSVAGHGSSEDESLRARQAGDLNINSSTSAIEADGRRSSAMFSGKTVLDDNATSAEEEKSVQANENLVTTSSLPTVGG